MKKLIFILLTNIFTVSAWGSYRSECIKNLQTHAKPSQIKACKHVKTHWGVSCVKSLNYYLKSSEIKACGRIDTFDEFECVDSLSYYAKASSIKGCDFDD